MGHPIILKIKHLVSLPTLKKNSKSVRNKIPNTMINSNNKLKNKEISRKGLKKKRKERNLRKMRNLEKINSDFNKDIKKKREGNKEKEKIKLRNLKLVELQSYLN